MLNSEFTIRPAQPTDAEGITNVLLRSIREICGPDYGNDPEVMADWCANKTPENISKWIKSENNFMIVAIVAGKISGVGLLRKSGHIMLCYILPEVLGRGVGKALLSGMEAEAVSLGLKELRLDSSITARDFYLKNGYQTEKEPDCTAKLVCYPMVKKI